MRPNDKGGIKMKKIIIGLLVLLSFILIPSNKVFAETVEDSFQREKQLEEYITKMKGSSKISEQISVLRRVGDNQAVYNLDLWNSVEDNKSMTGYNEKQSRNTGMNEGTFHQIMLISYYGYGYKNHLEDKWYAITQYMIWKEIDPNSTIYFTNTLNGNKVTKYEEEIAEINNLIKNHGNTSSFYGKTYQMKYLEYIHLIDEKNVLERFDIINNSRFNVNKANNDLLVRQNEAGKYSVMFVNKDKKFSTKTTVYIDEDIPKVVAPGSYYPIYMLVYFNLPSTDLKVQLLDKDTNLPIPEGEATLAFSKQVLFDKFGNVVMEGVTDEEGKIIFSNIAYGDYTIQEKTPSKGYKVDKIKKSITVSSDNPTFELLKEVNKSVINIQILKKNPITNLSKPISNIELSVYNHENELVQTILSDERGYCSLTLPFGTYLIKQTSTLENYNLPDDIIFEVDTYSRNASYYLYNIEKTLTIRVSNIDSDSKLPILESGIEFRIKNLTTMEYITDENNQPLLLKTGEQGVIDNILLTSGIYQLEQVSSIDGYTSFDTTIPFEITNSDDQKEIEILFLNHKITSTIQFDSYIEHYVDNKFVSKVLNLENSFKVYAKEDIISKDGTTL